MRRIRQLHRVAALPVAGALLLAACGDSIDEQVPTVDDTSASTVGGALAGGGLSVAEALATDAIGILAVRGFIVDDGVLARLCETLAESFPPQCGGASVAVPGYQAVDVGPLSQAEGVTWTDQPVVIFGELIDGTLVADPNVAG